MAQWKKLKYGFVLVAAGLSITAVTIYVTGRWRMKAVDPLELMQAAIERCLAVGTNNVALPSYTKTFTEYIYTNTVITNLGYPTTNTIIYTNAVTISNVVDGTVETNYYITTNEVVLTGTDFATNTVTFVITNSYSLTNALGWRKGRAYLNTLDPIIKALAPYYVDTNTVYDGTTNIVMHTFTGLLATLNLGDGTNFTAYSWRTKTNALRERYAVLNALEWTLESAYIGADDLRGPFDGPFGRTQGWWKVTGSNVLRKTGDASSWDTPPFDTWANAFFTFYDDTETNFLSMAGVRHAPPGSTNSLFRNNCDIIYSRTGMVNECNGVLYLLWKAPGDDVDPSHNFDDFDSLGITQNQYKIHYQTSSTSSVINLSFHHNPTNYVQNEPGGYGATFAVVVLDWVSSTNGFQYATNSLN